jgi:hypothetical protein
MDITFGLFRAAGACFVLTLAAVFFGFTPLAELLGFLVALGLVLGVLAFVVELLLVALGVRVLPPGRRM